MRNELTNMDKVSFLFNYYGEWQLRKMYARIHKEKLRTKLYAGRKVYSSEVGNEILKQKILAGTPFMAARFGATEVFVMAEVIRSECLKKKYDYRRLEHLNLNAGFTEHTDDAYKQFTELMIESTKECDFMGVWYNQMEDWFCKKYMPKDAILSHRQVYDFWNWEEPFTNAFNNQKVLVIHPFAETIESQYLKRKDLFDNSKILPEFELRTVKAVQTIAGQKDSRFVSWFEALDYMYEEAMKVDFDIALIACGAYGYPLAAKIKKAGKSAIHMGGVLQVLFGICGKRWDDFGIYNENWVRPNSDEMVENYKKIEGGCYW